MTGMTEWPLPKSQAKPPEAIEVAIASPACWIFSIWVRRMSSRTLVIASW